MPEIQQIPVAKVKANPANPRHVITQAMVDALAGSIQTSGLKNPIKVVRIAPPAEVASTSALGSQTGGLAPSQSPSTSSGHPIEIEYQIISGHIRFEAIRKLGWINIPALVLTLTPDQILVEAIMDNLGQPMTWLDLYECVESLSKITPKINQDVIAKALKITQPTVSRARTLLKSLTKGAKEQIYQLLINSDDYQIPEKPVYALLGLGNPQKIETALKTVIAKQMTEAQVKAMVDKINSGKAKASRPGPVEKPVNPYADLEALLPPGSQIKDGSMAVRLTLSIPHDKTKAVAQAIQTALGDISNHPIYPKVSNIQQNPVEPEHQTFKELIDSIKKDWRGEFDTPEERKKKAEEREERELINNHLKGEFKKLFSWKKSAKK